MIPVLVGPSRPLEDEAGGGRMRLVDMESRPAPTGAIVAGLDLADGTRLRTARWATEADGAPGQGTVLICTGRGEFIEKYFEVVGELLARGFAVVVFDWRGQGFSTRALRDRRKGHVASFDLFDRDLTAVIQRVLLPFCPKPHYALAHSMGGAVAIRCARRDPGAFERIVLSAPMIAIHDLPFPRHVRHLARALVTSGFAGASMPKGERAAVLEHGFQGNILTSDARRFATMTAMVEAEPRLAVGAPTIGWLDAAFRAMQAFESPSWSEAETTPMLMVVPGSDRVISVERMQSFAQRLRSCQCVTIPYARHEILMERDPLRDQFWAAFDAFIPGRAGARDVAAQRNPGRQEPGPDIRY